MISKVRQTDALSCSLPAGFDCVQVAEECFLNVAPETLISKAVDDRTEKAGY